MQTTSVTEHWLAFEGSSQAHSAKALDRGHIHQTYVIESEGGAIAILQKVNQRVFSDPDALIANANLLEPRLKETLSDLLASRIFTRCGHPCHIDAQGEYWRAFEFVSDSRNLNEPESVAQCFSGGQAFGRFQAVLRDVREGELRVCIEGFQDFSVVSRAFAHAIRSDVCGRLADSRQIADKLDAIKGQAPPLSGLCGVVHGDCKFNNLLFVEDEDRVAAVLDLDTVMWHRRALDFGDLLRAGAVRGAEHDEQAELDLGRVCAFAAGFREGAGDLMPETSQLVDALLHVTCMLSLRFYADHLNGDKYFNVGAPGDNLARAKGQCALFSQVLRRRRELMHVTAGE